MIELRCAQCGEAVQMSPDMGDRVLRDIFRRFVLEHEDCQEPACTCSFLYGPCRAHE